MQKRIQKAKSNESNLEEYRNTTTSQIQKKGGEEFRIIQKHNNNQSNSEERRSRVQKNTETKEA